ncbi:hypothetical protein GYA19_02250 [Candidatus Beckwithbacteria bacterium]|nr:hypothetical protein [Candidatus Beckwithbacteria bacterium]
MDFDNYSKTNNNSPFSGNRNNDFTKPVKKMVVVQDNDEELIQPQNLQPDLVEEESPQIEEPREVRQTNSNSINFVKSALFILPLFIITAMGLSVLFSSSFKKVNIGETATETNKTPSSLITKQENSQTSTQAEIFAQTSTSRDCEFSFKIKEFSCGDSGCSIDEDCGGDLVCTSNGYCAEEDLEDNCKNNPSDLACCGTLSCNESGCKTDDDCDNGLECAIEDDEDTGRCAKPDYVDACIDNPSYNNCCETTCWGTCDSDDDCDDDMECESVNGTNRCVNPDCTSESDCTCPTPTPTPTPTNAPPKAPVLPKAGGIPPTLIFTLGGIALVGLGLLF